MIIPAIDLLDGRVVRLRQGDFQATTDYGNEAVKRLKDYAEAGAPRLHLVDLTGAKNPAARQLPLIRRIVDALPAEVQLQTGGGIRTRDDVKALLDAGVTAVVVGSQAVKAPDVVRQWFTEFGPERIVLALDVRVSDLGSARVATAGWQETSGALIDDVVKTYLPCGLKHVLCTDIARDGMMTGPSVDLYARLAKAFPQVAWQASGGIASLADVRAAENAGAAGVIVGRALLENRFTVKEALSC